MNQELRRIFEEDQHDRTSGLMAEGVVERDADRRRRVRLLIEAGGLVEPADYYHAAMVFQHGIELADYWRAHELALKAAGLGYRPARWLAAAAYDRWLMNQGRPQKYGTQYRATAWNWVLWDVDPETTDEERSRWDVPPLAEAKRRATDFTPSEPSEWWRAAEAAPPLPLPNGEGTTRRWRGESGDEE